MMLLIVGPDSGYKLRIVIGCIKVNVSIECNVASPFSVNVKVVDPLACGGVVHCINDELIKAALETTDIGSPEKRQAIPLRIAPRK
jgi:hypothetical protein